ncbi:acyl-CoA N-acyltransferase [Gorgonomyces haynaldii]|nr:acyl-CoA N-acyltransferase [Gorgonomyces haynaldii]
MAILRLSTNADMPHIIHVTYEAWQDVGPSILTRDILSTITHQVLEQKRLANIKRDGFRSYVALVGDQIVGYIDGGSPREEYGDNEIYSLFVHPKYHRIGIAKNLLSAFLEQTQGSTLCCSTKPEEASFKGHS